MATLTDKQIQELNIAQERVNSGSGSDTDKRNLEYAKTKLGYTYTPQKPATPAPAPKPAPAPTQTTKKATLWSPTGVGTVVDVGSQQASQLQSQGYTLTKEEAVNKPKATVFNPTTGDRKAVYVGDPQAFVGGYVLETPTDNYEIRQKAKDEARINEEADRINDMISKAKDTDKTVRNDLTTKDGVKSELTDILQDGQTAEGIYNELYNTEEMKTARNEVIDLKSELDKYDQQLDEVEGDIRKEVSGEASESYITAKATLRSEDILKAKRSVQRDYDTALAQYQSMRDEAQNIYTARTADVNNRYNRLVQMLQIQIQEEGQEFNKGVALTNIGMQLPEGKSLTLPTGEKVTGLKERDDLNVVQFTDENMNTYVIAVNKTTGEEVYRTYIGKTKDTSSSGSVDKTPLSTLLKETNAQASLDFMDKVNSGVYGVARDDEGKTFYYNTTEYKKDLEDDTFDANKSWWALGNQKPKPIDYFVGYAN